MIRISHLLAAVGLTTLGVGAHSASAPASTESATSGGNPGILLIEGTGNAGEGWVEIAPVGSRATGPGGGKEEHGLVRLPFSVLGHTKILINMEHAAWVYSVGQPTEVTNLGRDQAGTVQARQAPILITHGTGEGFLEYVGEDGQVLNLPSHEDYLFPPDGFRYIKLPKGSMVKTID